MKVPSWIPEIDKCLWCNRMTLKPYKTGEDNGRLIVYYNCTNPECRCIKQRGKPAEHNFIFYGKTATKNYNDWLKEETKNEQE